MRIKRVLRCFFLKSSGLFFLAWMALGGAISAKVNGRLDQASTLFLVFGLIFLANGIINLLVEDKI